MKPWHCIAIGAGAIVALLLSFRIGQEYGKNSPVEPIKTKVDTLYIRDTIKVTEPLFVTRTKTERVLLPADTIRIHDTLMVVMQKERIEWRDSLSEVYASGIDVNVDSVRHFLQYRIVNRETIVPVKRHSHWGLGVSAGYGASLNRDAVILSPYIGVGLSYNIVSW